ncbi:MULTISPECIES: phage portal protein [Bacillus subtilis group]|uniref:phage portal protein n=1 Tax=Bacillus velezensis TaxID=492670 RepID=UPI000EF21954|nr:MULTISPECIES: phage portal protein [Bacillus subtilis group]AYK64165.1 phage portal protein [Bacillus subtilis subsp. subtilis]UBM44970.1 phage portal protein [Bacillus velezensis]
MKFKQKIKQLFNRVLFDKPLTTQSLVFGDALFSSKDELNEAIFSAVSRLGNTFASLPLRLHDNNYEQPSDCAAYNLLNDGIRYFTTFDFFRDIETIRNLKGNSYVQLFRNKNGQVVDMAIVSPDSCEPILDLTTGELYYAVSGVDNNPLQQTMYVHYSEMLHFKHIRSGQFKGMNPIDLLRNSIEYDQSVRQISLNQLRGSNEVLIVKFDASLDEDQKKAQIKQISNFYKENGGILVEENGITITRIERDLIDTNLIDIDKVTRSRVAMVYNVPEHFLGDKSASFSSLEQLNMEFVTNNLLPTIRQYEEELNKKLLTPEQKRKGYHFKFYVNSLLRGDTQTRQNYYQAAVRNSWMRPNEVRIEEGLPPDSDPNASKLWISGDLYPIETPVLERKGGEKKNDNEKPKE